MAVLALLTGCAGRHEAASGTSERAGSAGVTVVLPTGWHTTTPDDGSVVDPLTRLVVASVPIRSNESACQVGHYEFADDGVALVVLEWREPLRTLSQRPSRFTSHELPVQPPPAVECFDGSGAVAQFTDRGRAFGAYLLVGRQAPQQLLDEARGVLDTFRVEAGNKSARLRLARNGFGLSVPPGWHGRVLFREPTGRHGVTFQIANFALPENSGLEPPRELRPGEEDPIKVMGRGDVLVTVSDGAVGGPATPEHLTLNDLAVVEDPRVPRGHVLAEGSFCFGARCVAVAVDLGGAEPPDELVQRVNDVLASLAVGD